MLICRCFPDFGYRGDFSESRISNDSAGRLSAGRTIFPQSPTSDVGERTRIRRIRHFSRNHRAREDPSSGRNHANRLRHTPATSGIVESAAHRAEACTGMREGIHARHARAVKRSSWRAEHSSRRIGAFGLFGCVATPVPPRIRPRVLRAA